MLIILLILNTFIFAQHPFQVGEKLVYSAGFRFFSAGEAFIEMKADTLEDVPVLHLVYDTQTNSFLDKFYRVRDHVEVWLDTTDLSLLKMQKRIREGRYKKDHHAIIDTINNIAQFEGGEISVPDVVFDPLGAIYHLRCQDFDIGSVFDFSTYDNGKLKKVVVSVTHTDKVSVPAGIFNCYVISPTAADGKKLLKNEGQMKIWLTKDEQKLPVRIEQKANVGTMVLELKEVVIIQPEEEPENLEQSGNVVEKNKKEKDHQK